MDDITDVITDSSQDEMGDEDLSSDDDSSGDENDEISDDPNDMSDMRNDNWEEGVKEDVGSITCTEQFTVSEAVHKCRNFVGIINKSSILSNFINNEKVKDGLTNSMILDCKSRWSSTHRMIQSIVDHKSIIGRLFANKYELNLPRKQRTK